MVQDEADESLGDFEAVLRLSAVKSKSKTSWGLGSIKAYDRQLNIEGRNLLTNKILI